MKPFSRPLTAEEEKYYLEKYYSGDINAKNILIEHNLRLVAHIAKKYQGANEDPEDLISIGTIGLIKAISTFDLTKTTRLSTYAARCIDNELLMMFRSRKKHSREVSLQEPIGTDKEGNDICLLDIIEAPPMDYAEKFYQKEALRQLFLLMDSVLSEREFQVICLRFGLFQNPEQTQKEIAKKLSISRSYVSRIEKTAISKLRTLFRDFDF